MKLDQFFKVALDRYLAQVGREVAKRLLELGEIWIDENGFLRLAAE